jgi:HEAT repeats
MSSRWTVLAMFAVATLLIDSRAAGATGPPTSLPGQVLEVTATSSHVTLTARERTLADVLNAISQQAGVKIVLRSDFNTPITATFDNVPLDEAIRRLSRWHSVVLIYDSSDRGPDDAVLKEAWITSAPADARSTSPGVAQSEVGRRQQVSPVRNPRFATTPRPPTASNPGSQANDSGSQASDSKLAMALKRVAADSGKQDIEMLVRVKGADGAVNILREAATRDPDEEVRRGAIKALASLGSPDAVAAIRGTLTDSLADVRKEARLALRRLEQAQKGNK